MLNQRTDSRRSSSLGAILALIFSSPPAAHAEDTYVYKTINFPGSTSTFPLVINDSTQVVGNYQVGNVGGEVFLYGDGAYTTISAPGSTITESPALNNSGEIVGNFENPNNNQIRGFLYNDAYTTIDVPGAGITEPKSINISGQIAGQYYTGVNGIGGPQGFLYSEGVYITSMILVARELKSIR